MVSDTTIEVEGLEKVLENSLKEAAKAAQNLANEDPKHPTRALGPAAGLSAAAATINPKVIAATAPSVINFVH